MCNAFRNMAESRIPGFMDPTDWTPGRTPGTLGLNDQADPNLCTLLADTPGTLGILDHASKDHPTILNISGGMLWNTGRLKSGEVITPGPVSGSAIMKASKCVASELKTLFPDASAPYLQQVADDVNSNPQKFGLDSALRRAHFFAQIRQEGGPAMSPKEEEMYYSIEALKKKKYYQAHPEEAEVDGYIRDKKTRKFTQSPKEEDIANKVYSSNFENGPPESGDGWKYRGRGLIQVTWKENYRRINGWYAKIYGESAVDFVKNPDLLVKFPYSLRTAVCFWLMRHCPQVADAGSQPTNVDSITRIVNRDTDSYQERRAHFAIAHANFT